VQFVPAGTLLVANQQPNIACSGHSRYRTTRVFVPDRRGRDSHSERNRKWL